MAAFVQVGMHTVNSTTITVGSGSTDAWATPTAGNAILVVTTATTTAGTLSLTTPSKPVGWNHTVGSDQSTSAWLWVSDGTETSLITTSTSTDNLASIAVELSGLGPAPEFVTPSGGTAFCLETEAASTTTVGSGSFLVPYDEVTVFGALGTQALSGSISASPTGYTAAIGLTTRRLQLVYKLDCTAGSSEPATGTWTWGTSGNAHSLVFGVAATQVPSMSRRRAHMLPLLAS